MKTLCHRVLIVLALLVGTSPVGAVDTSAPAADTLSGARARIAEKQWAAAVEELSRVNDRGSADWNNLMGYSLRKQATPDYAAAEKFYAEALRIDPRHRGALEYSGELYLMTGDLAKAEERLAALDKACRFSCGEYRDLKRAIERFKAAGNKFVAAP